MSKDVSSFYLYYASKLLNKYLGEQENAILEMHEITGQKKSLPGGRLNHYRTTSDIKDAIFF